MNHFYLQQGKSPEIQPFPHIIEFANQRIQSVQLNSLPVTKKEGIRIFNVIEGKFEWTIKGQSFLLYPGDVALISPWEEFGSPKGILDVGTVSWVTVKIEKFETTGELNIGDWSRISEAENVGIGKIIKFKSQPVIPRFKIVGEIFRYLENELIHKEIGYRSRVNQLLDELFITIVRQLTKQGNSRRDFPQIFTKLEQTLRENLTYQWTVEEMAAMVGLGTTSFTEKVKKYTGFSPMNYLINIRISEAIKLLKKTKSSLTVIAFDTGFYSSQHFSTTFKKMVGYTPKQFRAMHTKDITAQ